MISEANETECDHCLGLKDELCGDYLVFNSDEYTDLSNYLDISFKYCPECGQLLPDRYGNIDRLCDVKALYPNKC